MTTWMSGLMGAQLAMLADHYEGEAGSDCAHRMPTWPDSATGALSFFGLPADRFDEALVMIHACGCFSMLCEGVWSEPVEPGPFREMLTALYRIRRAHFMQATAEARAQREAWLDAEVARFEAELEAAG